MHNELWFILLKVINSKSVGQVFSILTVPWDSFILETIWTEIKFKYYKIDTVREEKLKFETSWAILIFSEKNSYLYLEKFINVYEIKESSSCYLVFGEDISNYTAIRIIKYALNTIEN